MRHLLSLQDKFGGVLDNPSLAEEIASDPVLRHLKLIAAVSNPALLPRLAERGFPHWGVWMQVTGRAGVSVAAGCARLRGC
jgi:isoamylase